MSEPHPRSPAGKAPDALVGRVLSERYRIIRRISEGDRGGVYLAEQVQHGRKVALKVLAADAATPGAVDRFLDEARTVARIGHENVIDIFYGGRSPNGYVFLAMEYLEGVDLAHVLRAEGPLPWTRAQPILLQTAAALGAAHQHGIVHRDIKPANVFLVERAGRNDVVKLLDFGVAMVEAGIERTDEGRISGTPEYMAPEQVQAGAIDRRADVYSLGCVAYHMVTGQPPFQAPSILTMLGKHLTEPPQPPSTRRPDLAIPAEVDAVIMRALAKDPDQRWADMTAFAAALQGCQPAPRSGPRPVEGVPQPAAPTPTGAVRARARLAPLRTTLGVVAVMLAIGGAAAGYQLWMHAPGHIHISATPEDATVLIDDVALAARAPVTFDAPPGRYTVAVSRDGYVPVRQLVDIRPRATVTVPVTLQPAPIPAAKRAK